MPSSFGSAWRGNGVWDAAGAFMFFFYTCMGGVWSGSKDTQGANV